jgi:hypothetical protein
MALQGCASGPDFNHMSDESGRNAVVESGQLFLECVPYARLHSSVKLYGDAYTWWDKATGKYPQGASPLDGAVMVLTNYAGPQHGHVAVVRRIVSPREIRVDHANWLSNGAIYINNPVQDVSAANDWSQVRVYNITAGTWGTKVYPVQGFIGGEGGANMQWQTVDEAKAKDRVE